MPKSARPHTLIYKRTHPGDPDHLGRFGIEDCMGQVRAWEFDSVIGVGGTGAQARSWGINAKVNWIGIAAHKHASSAGRGHPIVTFDRFVLFEEAGPPFAGLAPRLAKRLFDRNVRVLMHDVDEHERDEVAKILRLAVDAAPSSKARPTRPSRARECCAPRICSR